MNYFFKTIIILLFFFLYLKAFAINDDSNFPTSPKLKKRIDFWINVYSKLDDTKGYLHDQKNLELIYQTIDLSNLTRRQKIRKIRKYKRKIRTILRSIAIGKTPKNNFNLYTYNYLKRSSRKEVLKKINCIRFQRGQRNRFKKGLERSIPFIKMIKNKFVKASLPERLAYLPHVESSFNHKAYSKVGAAGMWQFMRSTARLFRLKMNYIIDERRDPKKSTNAAIKLLKDNYLKLKAWPLAITAYNHGPNGMKRAVKKLNTKNLSTIIDNYNGRRFGFASKNFFACFMAASYVAENYLLFFKNINSSAQYFNTINFKINARYSLRDLSNISGISLRTLEYLNPKIRPYVFKRKILLPSNFLLKLPSSHSFSLFRYKNILRNASKNRAMINELEQTTKIYDNYNYGLAETYEQNLINSIQNLDSFFSNLIPTQSPIKTSVLIPFIRTNNQYDFSITKIKPNLYAIRIEVDETLGHYCDWQNIRLSKIIKHNNLSRRKTIYLGKKLILPILDKNIEKFKNKRMKYHQAIEEEFFLNYKIEGLEDYVVKRGDTLSSIAINNNLPLWIIRYYQEIKLNIRLIKGQKIIIPNLKAISDNAIDNDE